jgi:hypothetical protein
LKISQSTSLRKLAFILCDFLSSDGIDTVLTGGACVSLYTENEYLSYDLDFVLLDLANRNKARKKVEALGFKPDGRHFRHPDSPFLVEFLSPPLSVGEEPVREVSSLHEEGLTLMLLSPTDCVKDRLAGFFHWNDIPSLEQAVLVSLSQTVDLDEIKRWSRVEGKQDLYRIFLKELENARQKGD